MIFDIAQSDRQPYLKATLLKPDKTAYNLTGATVTFKMNTEAGVAKVSALAALLDAANGIVEYHWTSGDTDTAGRFTGNFVVVLAGGEQVTVPNDGYISIIIAAKLA